MRRAHYNDLRALMAVAQERSFTRAAARMGVSQAALSYTVRVLEQRLGIRLLTRTTRSVTPTEAGERLLAQIRPHFASIDSAIDDLSELRDRPSGTLRINSSDPASEQVVWPKLQALLDTYADIRVEITDQSNLADIVAEGFDAGIRLGEQVAKGMIAVPVTPPLRMAVVGAPDYFKRCGVPRTPQDLTVHDCINMRLLTQGGAVCVGVRKGWPQRERAGGGAADVEQCAPDRPGGTGGPRPGLRAGPDRRRCSGGQAADAGDAGVVPAFSRFPSLLPKPAPELAGVRAAG